MIVAQLTLGDDWTAVFLWLPRRNLRCCSPHLPQNETGEWGMGLMGWWLPWSREVTSLPVAFAMPMDVMALSARTIFFQNSTNSYVRVMFENSYSCANDDGRRDDDIQVGADWRRRRPAAMIYY